MHWGFPVLQLIVSVLFSLVWYFMRVNKISAITPKPSNRKGGINTTKHSPYLLLNLPFCIFLPADHGIIWNFSFVCVNVLFIGGAEAMRLLILSAAAAFSHSLEEENSLGVPCQIYLLRLGAGRFDRVCFSESLISAVTSIFIRI